MKASKNTNMDPIAAPPTASGPEYPQLSAWLEGDKIAWDASQPFKADPAGILNAFLNIFSDEDVLTFVQRYGPVQFCDHGLPWGHDLNRVYLLDGFAEYWSLDHGPCYRGGEPTSFDLIGRYFYYANAASTMLAQATLLADEQVGDPAAWLTILEPICGEEFLRDWGEYMLPDDATLGRHLLADVCTEWLRMSGVTLAMTPWSGLQIQLLSRNFGEIALSLAVSIVSEARGSSIVIKTADGRNRFEVAESAETIRPGG